MLQGKLLVSKKGEKDRAVFPVDFKQYLEPKGWAVKNETETPNDSGEKAPEPPKDVTPKTKNSGRAKKSK